MQERQERQERLLRTGCLTLTSSGTRFRRRKRSWTKLGRTGLAQEQEGGRWQGGGVYSHEAGAARKAVTFRAPLKGHRRMHSEVSFFEGCLLLRRHRAHSSFCSSAMARPL